MMNNKAQSQETFAQRSAINEHFAELGLGFTLIVDLLNLLIGQEPGKATNLKGNVNKGTNGGKPTQLDKVDEAIDAFDNAAGAVKEIGEASKKPDMIYTHTDKKDSNKDVQVNREYY
jgi:hypothetical protein